MAWTMLASGGKSSKIAPALGLALALLLAPSATAGVWEGDGPWGPYGWDAKAQRFHQPVLGASIPKPEPLGGLDRADFDGDGVANAGDNCLLVPNAGQRPAVAPKADSARRAYRAERGPRDLIRLAERWKVNHPNARFLTDGELGEACSGYSDNYLQTTAALVAAPNRTKLAVFRYLGAAGPMFGGAAKPFPSGKPTDFDRFGSVPGDASPSPTPRESLAQNADGSLARGNMTPSMPMCSGYDQFAGFITWLTRADQFPGSTQFSDQLRAQWEVYERTLGCGSDLQRPIWEQGMRHFWAGKRLYTNARGGRITNRFFASMTEHPLYDFFLKMEPFNTMAERSGFHPYADEPETSGQSRHGIIFRGRSYIDGRQAIVMDWRGFEAAWPLGQGGHAEGLGGVLIYDECRAIQTGVYNCTAVTDWVMGERRHTFQEGYMPWVAKGPPTVSEYVAAVR